MTTFGMTITGPVGTLDLEAGPYSLEKTTAEERQVTWRKQTVTDDHVEAEFTVAAVRGMVVEPVAVWITDPSQAVVEAATRALTDCFEQLQYAISWTVDDVTQLWTCQVAEYAVRTQHEYLHGHIALVRAQVPRKPKVVLV